MVEVEIFSAYVQILARCYIEPASNGVMPDIEYKMLVSIFHPTLLK